MLLGKNEVSGDAVLGHEGPVDRSHTLRTVTRVDGRADSNVVVLIVIGLGHCFQEDLMEEHVGRRKIPSETSQPTWVRRAVSRRRRAIFWKSQKEPDSIATRREEIEES